ncbi:hypothetical protein ACFVVX_26185 [Kitasatospora sp. NPDC058170]|uniref:hypothetical protein n=1 Tax=Kitasatospora sp. NPDC058170 TaxID=3346364 RepID=UPI0036DBA94B
MGAVRLVSVAVTAAVLVAGLSACGSGGKADPKAAGDAVGGKVLDLDPKAALAASALVMQKAGNGSVRIVAQEDNVAGTAEWQHPKSSSDLTGQAEGGTKARIIGDEVFLGGGPKVTAGLGGKHWARGDAKDPLVGPMAGMFLTMAQMINPVLQLTAAAQAGKPEKLGSETVEGVQTTHYRAVEDTAKLAEGLAALGADQRASVQKALEAYGKTLTVEFWINAKQELVRLKEYGDKGGEKASVIVTYSGLGAAPKIETPAAGDVAGAADFTKIILGGQPSR